MKKQKSELAKRNADRDYFFLIKTECASVHTFINSSSLSYICIYIKMFSCIYYKSYTLLFDPHPQLKFYFYLILNGIVRTFR